MNRLRRLSLSLALIGSLASLARAEAVAWQPWSDAVFAQAKRDHKFVLLDLEAVWCHWCHVMDATTYVDPTVVGLLSSQYIAIRVDQDSRPDLANRYEDYGWPATVVYGPGGTEIAKRQGYIPPTDMIRLLKAVIADPSPVQGQELETDLSNPPQSDSVLPAERLEALHKQWIAGYDEKAGGWGFSHKYLDWDNVELALREGSRGDAGAARRARATLTLQRKLIDPVWGGVYQYSVDGDWNEPHFEKIMPMQAEDLRIYAQAYALWRDPADLAAARAIRRYLHDFLTSPDGAFYVSQDADLSTSELGSDYFAHNDAGRRALGIPRIDKHLYARENGWAIAGLALYSAVADDLAARKSAEEAAHWVLDHRALPGGGYKHGETDPAGPYLGDTLAMGRAFLALYQLTADRAWLAHASEAADFIRAHFTRGSEPGFASSDTSLHGFPTPVPEFDENVSLARFATALANTDGRQENRATAASALRWALATGRPEKRSFYVAGVLLAEQEARTDPLHVAIIGRKDDETARALFKVALRLPSTHKLIEWWDRREGPAPRGEDIYPEMDQAAAFVCNHGSCSAPVYDAPSLVALLQKRAR